jgi:hypothetical protein
MDPAALYLILAAHLSSVDVEQRLLARAARWRAVRNATCIVVGNAPAGGDGALRALVGASGCEYARNPDYPARGFEIGAYRHGAALLEARAPGDGVALFAQDSLELEAPGAFDAALRRWSGRATCLLAFPKGVAWNAGIRARLEAWLPAYDDDAAWAGCTFNSFVARVADVADLAAAGFFEPVATNRADSGALERYFGYALAARSPREPPLCGRDLAGKCGLAKAHLWRPARAR